MAGTNAAAMTPKPSGIDNPFVQMRLGPETGVRYSREKVLVYLQRIRLPQKYLESPVFSNPALAWTKEHGLPLIKAICRWHSANIPFENLALHYSDHHRISLDADDLHRRFAEFGTQYGRGGRCMETNGFFGNILRSLGYRVKNGAGRVSRMMSPDTFARETQGTTYDPWNHMVNFVKFDDEWWLVDVGMGAMGPNLPIPLEDGFETISIEPRRIRLQYRPIAEHAKYDEGDVQKLWCLDVCHHPQDNAAENKWLATYCFATTEFLPQDYEMMSWFTSTSARSFFTRSVLCTKLIMDENTEKLIGDLTLFNDSVRKTVRGERELVKELKTEQERIDALKELFQVNLTPEEKAGIPLGLRLAD